MMFDEVTVSASMTTSPAIQKAAAGFPASGVDLHMWTLVLAAPTIAFTACCYDKRVTA